MPRQTMVALSRDDLSARRHAAERVTYDFAAAFDADPHDVVLSVPGRGVIVEAVRFGTTGAGSDGARFTLILDDGAAGDSESIVLGEQEGPAQEQMQFLAPITCKAGTRVRMQLAALGAGAPTRMHWLVNAYYFRSVPARTAEMPNAPTGS